MAMLLAGATCGSDDPTRAALPLLAARGAIDSGNEAEVFLMGEAVYMIKEEIARAMNPVGWPNVGELIGALVSDGVRFYV
jgi:predicted peroxiredoxin